MATYEFTERIKFILPPGFMLTREENEDGEEVVKIISGEYENEDGETLYKFSCNVNFNEFDPEEVDDGITSANLLDKLVECMEDVRSLKLPGKPEVVFVNKGTPVSIFGRLLKMFACMCMVRVSAWSTLQLFSVTQKRDDEPDENALVYENMYEVLKAVRINGRKIPVEGVSASMLQEALELSFDEDEEAMDLSPKIQINFTAGDETTTYEYTQDGMKEVGKEKLSHATPDESLYPHYNSMLSAGGMGFLGANVVVNASGTEYEFIPLSQRVSDPDVSEDTKALLNRIISKDTAKYDLHEKAKEMQPLFHVNEAVFDPHHDRECELEEGYMHRAYMMSALRSFAWTLAEYCQEHDCTPDDVDSGVATRIANFVARENWLNYDGDSHCQGLCSGSDLHVFFVPDSVSAADKKKLLPDQEDIDRVKQMKEKFPAYREILCEVHSLNALRKDLKYIYPAVKQLWDSLEAERDYDEALLGNEADIVYAWCALAFAAKEPFFSEDGPMSCYFCQIIDEEVLTERDGAAEEERAREAAMEWMNKYGSYIEKDPDIDFNGTLFAFSGLAGHWEEKEHPTVQKVIEKGGQYRSKVSGLTNYLVVNPADAGSSKIVAVMEQRQKGKNVKVILLSDLEAALGGTRASTPKSTAKQSDAQMTNAPASKGKKTPKKDCDIDDENRLTNYNGSERHIILPQGLEIIGANALMASEIESVVVPEGVERIEDSAFMGCKALKEVILPSSLRVIETDAFRMCLELESIVIPEGVYEIGMDVFTSCNKLKDIYLPNSLWDIGVDAFCTFCTGMTLHVPKGSDAETYAKDNDIQYDNKKAPTATATAASGKSAAKKASTVTSGKPKAKEAPAPAKSAARMSSSAADFKIEDGVLTEYSGTATDIVIPAGVTEIDSFVFYENNNLISLVIPAGVRSIGNCAFGYCPNLEKVSLPESLEVLAGFNSTPKLASIEIPPRVRIIQESTFNYCEGLKKVIIPLSVTKIDDSAFAFCKNLADIFIPATVEEMHEYTFLGNSEMTIHTPAGSYAEAYAKRRMIACDNNVAGIWSDDAKGDSADVFDAASKLGTQIAGLDEQELSDEDREALKRAKEQLNEIGEDLAQGQVQMEKYGDYLEQKERREKAAEEEKTRLKAEAMAAGKSEWDVVNMYVILTNEKKLGKLHRSADEFYEIYEDDFAALSKAEVIRTRKDILAEMEDETLCAYYTASFRQRTVEDRFAVATRNLNNVSTEPELAIKAKWAVDNSKEWYQEGELAEVRRLMDSDLEATRADLDSQLDTIDSAWKKYATGKEFLQIVISDKAADGSDLQDNFSNFQIVVGGQLAQVQIASKGIFRMSTTVMNCMTWYWGVTVREIWEAAMKNEFYDKREGASDGGRIANQAMNQIRAKYPAPASASKPAAPVAPAAPAKPTPPVQPAAVNHTPASKPAKKEGCYIATAVYGSYDAPEVMTLRRFRDEVLSRSTFGRWFIRTYYRLSPSVAERLKEAKMMNRLVRNLLDKLVSKLNNKQH